MAPFKRKADHEIASVKKEKAPSSDRSAKRQRKSIPSVEEAKQAAKSSIAPTQNHAQASVLKNEERSFPRGGASVLTPLEHKQIQIKANQDVLFEQSGLKRGGADGLSDEGSEAGVEESPPASKKRRSKKSKKSHLVEPEEQKRIVRGTMVLGQVSEITSRDIVLSLPNNLSGFVSLTAISNKLTARIEKLVQEEESSSAEFNGSEDFEDINLKDMFYVGQYLRACVTSTEDAPTSGAAKGKKRIELSIDPKMVNSGITKSNIAVHGMVQASVVSNEDHGLVMDMGLEGSELKGFLPKSELGKRIKHSNVQEGAVFLCLVSGLNSDRRIVKLSADQEKAGNLKKSKYVTEASTIDVFLPGTAVDMLVADSTSTTVTGKIIGLLDATADIIHTGAAEKGESLSDKYVPGAKVKVRVIYTFPDADPKKVGVSLLDHVVSLSSRTSGKAKDKGNPLDIVPLSSTAEEAKVIRVEPLGGLYLDLGFKGVIGFAHISRLTDGRIERLSEASGPYKLGSTHRARVLSYNPIDGLFQVSLEQRVLEQPFLRIEDVPVGRIVKGKVQKLLADRNGSTAALVDLAEGITGLVTEMHLADVHLQHPERKFREGASVTARVLSTDVEKRHIRLTLKKSLINTEAEPWTDYSSVTEGDMRPGTIVDIKPSGALVRFFGNVCAWLPVAEMSEAFIEDATRHFQRGQVVNVRVISLDREEGRMLVSCKDPESVGAERECAFKSLNPGDIVQGTIIEKSTESVIVDLGHGVKGILRLGHLTDGSEKKDKHTMARIRVGGPLEDVVVIEKHFKSRTVTLSNKPSLRKDAQAGKLVTRFEDIREGETIHGFVRGITPDKVFIEFGARVVGLLYKSQLSNDMVESPNFGLRKDQSVVARVTHIDPSQNRFWLSMKSEADALGNTGGKSKIMGGPGEATVNAIDKDLKSTADLSFGVLTTARIRSIKSTQLNVQLAENVLGRISASEIFDKWADIKDKKHPLQQFKMNDIVSVKVLGMHDARNHRFLPISHRQGRVPTFELTAKTKEDLTSEADVLTLDKIIPGSSFIAFINNIDKHCVWVNISANVRGRIELLDLSDDLSLLSDVEENFPVGSALKVRVKAVDIAAGRLDLTAATNPSAKSLTLENLKEGIVLPARVTKVNDSSIVVHINENIAGPVYLPQLADNYDNANPSDYKLGDLVRVCVIEVDVPNKKVGLSVRPSKVLSSSFPVKDPDFTHRSQLHINQVVRGFIKRVADNGLFVRLGPHIDAYVRIGELSDSFIKDWKAGFRVDQLVTGKVISNNPNAKSVQLSLKKSILEKDYVPPLTFEDMKVGQIVTGKVRKVEDFGVFIVVDNSNNVSGLCHASEMANGRVDNVKELYKEGDAVKARVLSVSLEKRRVNFGLKYSYVEDKEEDDAKLDDAPSVANKGDNDEDVDTRSIQSAESDGDFEIQDNIDIDEAVLPSESSLSLGLKTSGFDWTGAILDFDDQKRAPDSSDEEPTKKKKRHKKATVKEDLTGDLDARGPQSVADYERLLLGQPNSAELWVRYMVFQRELNEIEKARQIARRALATMNPREEKERCDVWTALLHLENDFSNDDVVGEVFNEARQFNDAREIHERMIKIYISSGKLDKADSIYQTMMKNKSLTQNPQLWLSYAAFLMSTLQPSSPARARALLPRATQSVPEHQHRYLTSKFAALEFKSPNGDPERGRTIFEGLVSAWPKKGDIWDMYLSLEIAHGGQENVRGLFERMTKSKLKKRRGEGLFRKWRDWEVSVGNMKGVEKVAVLERTWVEGREGEGEE
ncbi:nucleic acid-binding protein [Lindgomyces ingoldianus]|uniref:Nucleic acid-binding protein n=1 Tax=Lindgomyces ingoldianus TaxID=673940 RepID=A0ACB6QPF9_9PLEO|nr:nucleic acid-binding protein [Lindgomyces ingoldianus]KAF2468899.1 nucleic acid-binding protein [Lindgomyces ingoldianus]